MFQDGAARRAVHAVKRGMTDLAKRIGQEMKRHDRRMTQLEARIQKLEDAQRDR